MFKRIATASLVFGMAAMAPPAEAQATCGDRDKIVSRLQITYGESRTGAGMKGANSIFEIWASLETGTWTILMSRPDGTSCVMASGESWEHVPLETIISGAPA